MIGSQQDRTAQADHIQYEWPLPSAVTLGSALRSKGIERELRRQLPWALRKHLTVEPGRIVASVPNSDHDALQILRQRVDAAVAGLHQLPILPSELEDIISISQRERHKWLADGRLQSAGTRTVKLRGRAKKVTFHVFDPRYVEDILDADLPELWREEDARTAAENRKRAAGKAALRRGAKRKANCETAPDEDERLVGWEEFDAEGFLR